MDSSKRQLTAAALLLCALGAGCAAPPPAPPGMSRFMADKLRHAQEGLAAVARADFEAIAAHATALRRISAETAALTQDTVTYSVLSDQFREIAGTLASQAAARDLAGVTASWVELTRTCLACHTQINRERLLGDFPGKVSRRGPEAPDVLQGTDS